MGEKYFDLKSMEPEAHTALRNTLQPPPRSPRNRNCLQDSVSTTFRLNIEFKELDLSSRLCEYKFRFSIMSLLISSIHAILHPTLFTAFHCTSRKIDVSKLLCERTARPKPAPAMRFDSPQLVLADVSGRYKRYVTCKAELVTPTRKRPVRDLNVSDIEPTNLALIDRRLYTLTDADVLAIEEHEEAVANEPLSTLDPTFEGDHLRRNANAMECCWQETLTGRTDLHGRHARCTLQECKVRGAVIFDSQLTKCEVDNRGGKTGQCFIRSSRLDLCTILSTHLDSAVASQTIFMTCRLVRSGLENCTVQEGSMAYDCQLKRDCSIFSSSIDDSRISDSAVFNCKLEGSEVSACRLVKSRLVNCRVANCLEIVDCVFEKCWVWKVEQWQTLGGPTWGWTFVEQFGAGTWR